MENKLLNALISDQKSAADIYKPSSYWWKKSISARREIRKNGLDNFRSSTDINTAATAYGDNTVIDTRRIVETTSIQNKLGLAILNHTPLKRLFDFQVNTTRGFLKTILTLEKDKLALSNPERLTELLQNYKIGNSINFGCDRISTFKNKEYSTYYLQILDLLDLIERNSTLKGLHSFLEIGPGFGANIHLVEQNFPDLRKFIAVDIVPNVWVVTEYLRNLYGESVKDYLVTKEKKEIKFKDDTSLEIFVLPPWQIEKISSLIDCFWNSNSFVEMSPRIVANYAEKFTKIRTKRTIYNFISYDRFDIKTTFRPDQIPELFFDVEFQKLKYPSLTNAERENYFYLGKPMQS
jgi:putative sugar O-methyltransferase